MNGNGSSDSHSSRFDLVVLFLVVTLTLFDRQLINILAQDIKTDLVLSDAELGLLTGTAFGLLKALFSIPIGALADRRDRSQVLAGLVALYSSFSMLCGMAGSFLGLAIGRMGIGIGESAAIPVASAMVRDRFPTRATSALALVVTGNPIGTFLALLIGGVIADRLGWRWAFVLTGPPGLALAWILLTRVRDAGGQAASTSADQHWLRSAVALAANPLVRRLMFATAGSMFLVSAASAWVPAFFMRVHGLGTAEMGLYAAVAIGVGGSLGALSGMLCDLVRPRIGHPESLIMIVTVIGALPFLLATVFSGSTFAAIASYFIYNLLVYAWLAPTIRLIQDAVDASQRALALALCSAVGMLTGLGFGIPVVGWVSDLLSAVYGARSIGIALCIVTAIAMLVGLTSHLLILKKLIEGARQPTADSDKFRSPLGKSPVA